MILTKQLNVLSDNTTVTVVTDSGVVLADKLGIKELKGLLQRREYLFDNAYVKRVISTGTNMTTIKVKER